MDGCQKGAAGRHKLVCGAMERHGEAWRDMEKDHDSCRRAEAGEEAAQGAAKGLCRWNWLLHLELVPLSPDPTPPHPTPPATPSPPGTPPPPHPTPTPPRPCHAIPPLQPSPHPNQLSPTHPSHPTRPNRRFTLPCPGLLTPPQITSPLRALAPSPPPHMPPAPYLRLVCGN